MIPKKLQKGDRIHIIAPAESLLPKFTEEMKLRGIRRLESLGLKVSFGKYVEKLGPFDSATIKERLEDLHRAFTDKSVDAVLSANGGASANQLLKHIDYDLIKNNPKIFCGLSDITELTCAISAKTGLVTYYGPHFTSIGATQHDQYVLKNMEETFFLENETQLKPPEFYGNSEWDQEFILNEGYWTIHPGTARGTCFGGNLLTLNFLLGYDYIPDLSHSILFLEENKVIDYKGIQKEVQQIINHPSSGSLKGLIIGRFQRESKMDRKHLTQMIQSMEELRGIPVIANVDCSHTVPMATFPFGGVIRFSAEEGDRVEVFIEKH